jgi:protein-S-isoprenylcysteine O-methyltransferase Ste14
MSIMVIVLRAITVLALAGLRVFVSRRVDKGSRRCANQTGSSRAPLLANFAAFVLHFTVLFVLPGSTSGPGALLLAFGGALLAVAGTVLVVTSRHELGRAWSFLARSDRGIGLVTTGPYHFVRHPIYLGLGMIALGQALAFRSWPALVVVLCGIIPTFAWRAHVEENLLRHTFGERYVVYRRRTRMIVPGVL